MIKKLPYPEPLQAPLIHPQKPSPWENRENLIDLHKC